MTSVSTVREQSFAVPGGSVSMALAVSGCSAGGGSNNGNSIVTTLTVGITESVKLTSPPDFTVVLKKRLICSIGDRFASSDVKFSFDRQPQIADQNGPSTLFYEEGTGAEVLGAPKHPYTRRLLASLPVPNPAEQATRREALRMLRAED